MTVPDGRQGPAEGPRGPRVSDRRVLLLLGALVAVVLAANAISGLVPGADAALATAPLVVLLLVVVTGTVLVRTLRGR